MNGSKRHTYGGIRKQFMDELQSEQMSKRLYNSIENISRLLNAIIITKGTGWAAQVLDEEGNQILTNQEQEIMTEKLEPYMDDIIMFFDDKMTGGALIGSKASKIGSDIQTQLSKSSELSGLSKDFLKKKLDHITHTDGISMDDVFLKVINKLESIDSTVNNFASEYGILRLEKESDLNGDIHIIPAPIASGIATGIFGLLEIPPQATEEVLSKVKVPFRSIVFIVYFMLDIARVSISVSGNNIGRKIMSILLALLEILRGDWKKAILSIIGYYGTMPLLMGELMKVFLSIFRTYDDALQHDMVFAAFNNTKSLIVGILLSIFQATAPEEVRLPLIGALEKVAHKKAEMDGILVDAGLSARPDYLSPTWDDLHNIKAVINDEAYVCSCEFEELIKSVNKTAIIQFILEMIGIPINEKFRSVKCGTEPCRDIVTTFVKKAKEETDEKRDRLQDTVKEITADTVTAEALTAKNAANTLNVSNKSKNRIIRSRNYLTSST